MLKKQQPYSCKHCEPMSGSTLSSEPVLEAESSSRFGNNIVCSNISRNVLLSERCRSCRLAGRGREMFAASGDKRSKCLSAGGRNVGYAGTSASVLLPRRPNWLAKCTGGVTAFPRHFSSFPRNPRNPGLRRYISELLSHFCHSLADRFQENMRTSGLSSNNTNNPIRRAVLVLSVSLALVLEPLNASRPPPVVRSHEADRHDKPQHQDSELSPDDLDQGARHPQLQGVRADAPQGEDPTKTSQVLSTPVPLDADLTRWDKDLVPASGGGVMSPTPTETSKKRRRILLKRQADPLYGWMMMEGMPGGLLPPFSGQEETTIPPPPPTSTVETELEPLPLRREVPERVPAPSPPQLPESQQLFAELEPESIRRHEEDLIYLKGNQDAEVVFRQVKTIAGSTGLAHMAWEIDLRQQSNNQLALWTFCQRKIEDLDSPISLSSMHPE